MENLNNANFFNEVKRDNPLAYSDFMLWLEEYKEVNDWDLLFNNHLVSSEEAVGFTDAPLDFQLGVMLRYFNESPDLHHPIGNVSAYEDVQYIISAFQMYFILIDGYLVEEKKKVIISNN